MEFKMEILPGVTLDEAITGLLALKEKGLHAYCVFNGHVLHSDTVTVDSAYIQVMGCTKTEYVQQLGEWRERYENEEKARAIREQAYRETVAESRNGESRTITLEKVIEGLKFIAENQSISHNELVAGLLKLGCNFTLEDIKQQFPSNIMLFAGMEKGDVGCGASVIVNTRDSEFGRAFCHDRFLSVDDSSSIYHFIRITTGDESYTKAKVDALIKRKKRG